MNIGFPEVGEDIKKFIPATGKILKKNHIYKQERFFMLHSAVVGQGSSGGAVLNLKGEVVAMDVGRVSLLNSDSGKNIAFAASVPADIIKAWLKDVLQ